MEIIHYNFSGEKILVTGAGGFIGTHLCKELIMRGGEVHGVSRQERNTGDNGVRWSQVDLTDTKEVKHLMKTLRPDVIYHLASLVTGSRDLDFVIPVFYNNLLTTVNLLCAAGEVSCKRILLIGSMEEPVCQNQELLPGSPYAAAKWASSAYGRMFHALYQLPLVILRIFMVYGPGQRDLKKLVPYVILSLLRGESPRLSSGQRQVDWIYVDDVVEGLLTAAKIPQIEGNTIDIGSGELVSIRTIAESLSRMINPKIEPVFGALRDRPLEQLRVADIERSNRVIGWKPMIRIEEGLERTLTWYRQMFNESEI